MSIIGSKVRARLAPRSVTDDSGTALVLALLVVLVVGTLLAAVLDFTRTGLTVVPGERDDRNTSNYIQGSVQGAINSIRGSTELGRQDVADCPEFTPNVPTGLSGVTGKTFVVKCSGQSTGSTAGDDTPRFAIHALGTAANEGIIQDAGNGQLYINGGIYSSNKIAANSTGQASMRVNGTITARNGCTGNITTTDPLGKNCAAPASSFDTAPAYWPALTDDAALQALINSSGSLDVGADPKPTCAIGKAEFEPGYYQLTPEELLAKKLPTCNRSVFHMKPGIYYFDYQGPNGDGEWDLGSKKIIAGTYLSSTLGAACDHTDDATPAPGVQFIFGGASKIMTRSSTSAGAGMEVCGPEKGHSLNGTPQRIALYTLSARDSLASPVPSSAASVLTYSSGPTTSSTPPFLLPTNAQKIDGTSTTTLTLPNGRSATLEYPVLTTSVAKGSAVTAAGIEVSDVRSANVDASLTLSWPDGTSSGAVDITNANCPANVCDVLSELNDHDVTWRSLAEASVTYTAKSKNGGGGIREVAVDGIRWRVTARAPGLRATSCNTSSCVFLESDQNPNVFFHGTVYAPTAGFDVWIHNSGETIFDRGVIVRTIDINMNTSSKQTSSPFQIPQGTPNGRLVLFQGYVDGKEKVRACARYVDVAPNPDGSLSAYAGWSLTVPRWLVMRTQSTSAATCS